MPEIVNVDPMGGCFERGIVVHFTVEHVAGTVPYLVMWGVLLVNVGTSIHVNLRILKAQLLALRHGAAVVEVHEVERRRGGPPTR